MIKDIFDSLAKWWNERTSSPLYGTFIVAIVLVNWDVFYTLFWESDSKFVVPRVEYIRQNLLINLDFLGYFHRVIFPILITYIVISWLPYLSDWAFNRTQNFYYGRLKKADERKTEYLSSVAKTTEVQKKAKEEIISNTDSEEILEIAFDEFRKTKYFKEFGQIIYAILKNNGTGTVPTDVLAYFLAQSIIEIESSGIPSFTKKGEYYFKRYSETQPDLLELSIRRAERRRLDDDVPF